MALIKDYTLAGTSYTIPNAYHVITQISTEKRVSDILPPPDDSTESGFTEVGDRGPEVLWKAGYVCTIAITVWASKKDKEKGMRPVGFIGMNPTDNEYGQHIGHAAYDSRCMFLLDINNLNNELTQAYQYLMTLDFYRGAVVDD